MAREIAQQDLGYISKLLKDVLNETTYKTVERMGGLTNSYFVWTNGRVCFDRNIFSALSIQGALYHDFGQVGFDGY